MKKTIVLASVIFAVTAANAQKVKEAEVPAEVKASFTKKYAAAKVKGWEKEKGNYEAEFDYNKAEMSVVMDPKGNILETETEINVSELPKAVASYCAEKYKGKKVKEASKIVNAKGETTYEAEIEKMDVIFDANGKFLKEEKDNDNDKDKD